MGFAYVGCRTTIDRNARGKGIRVFKTDGDAAWQEVQLFTDLENPSYLAFDRNSVFLYCVHGDIDLVSAFSVDKVTGELSYLNSVSAGGRNPVFLSVDQTNRYLFVASLQGGAVCTFLRHEDGRLEGPIHGVHLPGKNEKGVSHAHQCLMDQSLRYLFVPTQGRGIGFGAINVFRLEFDGSLCRTQHLPARSGDEPRHVAVHPNNRYVYLMNERGNCVTFHTFDAVTGILTPRQILPSLPETYTGEGQASAILVHPNGQFVYASNRIHDSIAIYRIDPRTGFMKCIDFEPCLGKTPRFMTLDENGHHLYVANEDSDTIQVFHVDLETGLLEFSGLTVKTESPTCILFLN